MKPFLMPLLALWYFLSSSSPDNRIIAGLFFGWMGDVILLEKNKKRIAAGLAAFFMGHVMYICAVFRPVQFSLYMAAGILIYSAYIFLVVRKLFPYVGRKMRVPVSIYILIISLMSFLAFVRASAYPSLPVCLIWAGSVFFVISDSILAFAFFRKKREHLVMETYLAAQLLIVLGFLFS
ncbi:MAG: lysoplasmalogenase [Solobacterium sp.]|nr:lysoplasmalogenase [Solobacterium sp.]